MESAPDLTAYQLITLRGEFSIIRLAPQPAEVVEVGVGALRVLDREAPPHRSTAAADSPVAASRASTRDSAHSTVYEPTTSGSISTLPFRTIFASSESTRRRSDPSRDPRVPHSVWRRPGCHLHEDRNRTAHRGGPIAIYFLLPVTRSTYRGNLPSSTYGAQPVIKCRRPRVS